MSSRSDLFRSVFGDRVLVADGAMGTMLQAADPSLEDFEGYVALGLGVNSSNCYRAFVLQNPTRLVVDIQTS